MSVQSEIDRINGAKSTLAANIESAGFTAGEGASIVQLASTVGSAFTDTSSRLATVNGASGTISTQLDTLDGTKSAIKDAIVAKGVEVPEGTTFYEYAGLINGIETGEASANLPYIAYGNTYDEAMKKNNYNPDILTMAEIYIDLLEDESNKNSALLIAVPYTIDLIIDSVYDKSYSNEYTISTDNRRYVQIYNKNTGNNLVIHHDGSVDGSLPEKIDVKYGIVSSEQ